MLSDLYVSQRIAICGIEEHARGCRRGMRRNPPLCAVIHHTGAVP